MSTALISRSPFSAQIGPTCANVIDHVQRAPDLTSRQRQDLTSAVRVLCDKVLRKDPAMIPAHVAELRKSLAKVVPAEVGMRPGRWCNMRSLVLKALKVAGIQTQPGRHRAPLSVEWRGLARLLNDKYLSCSLSRLMRYCSVQGIPPTAVNDAVMTALHTALTDASLLKNPRDTHRRACRGWNLAAERFPTEWPQQRVVMPVYLETYTLPWQAFPESLHHDAEAYLRRLGGHDPLADLDFRPVTASTVRTREYQLRQIGSALVNRGYDPAAFRSLSDLITVSTVKDCLRFFLDRTDGETSTQIFGIACFLKQIARHWVQVDDEHYRQLQAICRRVDPGRRGMTEKNRARLRQLDDQTNLAAFVRLPQTILEHVRKSKLIDSRSALKIQTALAIELLLMTGMRRANLAGLSIERHVVRPRNGRTGPVHIAIPAGSVKNGEALEFELPAPTVQLLEIYLREFRPLLANGPSEWLFPGKTGGPKHPTGLSTLITETIRRETGLRIHVHLFRHAGAQLYLNANPGGYEVMRRVLGHRSMDTTTQFYAGMETKAAVKHFDESILKVRASITANSTPVPNLTGRGKTRS